MKHVQSGMTILGILFASGLSANAAGSFTVLNLDTATGINTQGDIVGTIRGHAALLSSGTTILIDFPGAIFTEPRGINDRQEIVGRYIDSSYASHGFLLRGGIFSTIDVPGAGFTEAYGINFQEDIVGVYRAGTAQHGFLLHDGAFTNIDYPGAVSTEALGINNGGDVVGSFSVAGPTLGFVLHKGSFAPFQFTAGAFITQLSGINSRGKIVGSFILHIPPSQGFVLSRGAATGIVLPNSVSSCPCEVDPFGINAHGDIVGFFAASRTGQSGAFLLTHN